MVLIVFKGLMKVIEGCRRLKFVDIEKTYITNAIETEIRQINPGLRIDFENMQEPSEHSQDFC